jgi:hypothetical protein
MTGENPSTHQKARRINLDARIHGTFAEIGAGQEVARWFFHVGGAAATVAKTMSAYDMAVSDAIYGPSDRYVSRHRLQSMLAYEYDLLMQRLGEKRGRATNFFVFADSVAARSYGRPEEGHGWIGIRFQHEPLAAPSDVLLHARLRDTENVREQEALGVLGVNLTYGAFYHRDDPTTLIRSLMDDLSGDRIEIDMMKLQGPAFGHVDNRLVSLQLVEQGFTEAAMFTADGEVVQPGEVLHQKPVLIERGSFRPVTKPTIHMLRSATAQFAGGLAPADDPPVVIMEMSLRNLLSGDHVDHKDFLARADVLGALGETVMISNYSAYYPVPAYLRRYTKKPLAFALGIPTLGELFDEQYYAELPGGLLQAFGNLFQVGVHLYVYPMRDEDTGALTTVENLRVAPHLRHVYAHLVENGRIVPIQNVNEDDLHILPRDVLAKIQSRDPSWETMVPEAAIPMIRDRDLFQAQPVTGSGSGHTSPRPRPRKPRRKQRQP